MEFEFKSPIIVTKTPTITYAFILSSTTSIDKTYTSRIEYAQLVSENEEFILKLVNAFTEKCSRYFSKPLDASKLLSRLIHSDYAVNEENIEETDEPVIFEWKYTPYRIIISGTEFKIEWCIDQIEIKCMIDLDPDNDEVLVKDENVKEDVSEVVSAMNDDEEQNEEPPVVQLGEVNIPVSEDTTPVTIKFDARKDEYKRLKKAQLRVEMAKFKAERAYARYIERWGYLSEDSGSDSE